MQLHWEWSIHCTKNNTYGLQPSRAKPKNYKELDLPRAQRVKAADPDVLYRVKVLEKKKRAGEGQLGWLQPLEGRMDPS